MCRWVAIRDRQGCGARKLWLVTPLGAERVSEISAKPVYLELAQRCWGPAAKGRKLGNREAMCHAPWEPWKLSQAPLGQDGQMGAKNGIEGGSGWLSGGELSGGNFRACAAHGGWS